jgi:type IV pilus assembly protein PilB
MNLSDIDSALASLCLDHRLLSAERAQEMIESAQGNPSTLTALMRSEIPEASILTAIAAELGYEYVNLYGARLGLRADPALLDRVDIELMRRRSAIPCIDEDGQIVVAVANPADSDLVAYLNERYDNMKVMLASISQIQSMLATTTSSARISLDAELFNAEADTSAPVPAQPRNRLATWVDAVLESAVAQGASDIHLEYSVNHTLMIRYRVDGILRIQPAPPANLSDDVIGMLMVRAGMDSANRLEPQDGTFTFIAAARKIDVRAAILPHENGPGMVLRILDSANISRRLADMGFEGNLLQTLETVARSPQGTVIFCGPTGSGKTTTLYALLNEVNSVEKNIETIEDPVEYRLPLMNQTAVNTFGDRKMNFSRILRAVLRMDPDIILVGEIRDEETAKTAMDAAITGHLVFSTLHARDAVGVYTRLSEMGVPLYLIAEAMSLAVSQRLVRRLHDCAVLATPSELQRQLFHQMGANEPEQLMSPVGCVSCGMTGFRGRLAVAELLAPTPAFRSMVLAGQGHDELEDQARRDGMIPMRDAGLSLVRRELTTIEEVARAVSS